MAGRQKTIPTRNGGQTLEETLVALVDAALPQLRLALLAILAPLLARIEAAETLAASETEARLGAEAAVRAAAATIAKRDRTIEKLGARIATLKPAAARANRLARRVEALDRDLKDHRRRADTAEARIAELERTIAQQSLLIEAQSDRIRRVAPEGEAVPLLEETPGIDQPRPAISDASDLGGLRGTPRRDDDLALPAADAEVPARDDATPGKPAREAPAAPTDARPGSRSAVPIGIATANPEIAMGAANGTSASGMKGGGSGSLPALFGARARRLASRIGGVIARWIPALPHLAGRLGRIRRT